MSIIAITKSGCEFIYKKSSAHRVSGKNAETIAAALNRIGYGIGTGEKWYVYQIDKYDQAAAFAECQRITLSKNGTLKRVSY